jgi:CheY-like chemotaxis protein
MSEPLDPSTVRTRVLVIDDEPTILELVEMFLEDPRYELTLAENGAVGLRHFESAPFDLVISDRVMPEMTGDELAAEIRSRAPEMPIILITGQHGGPHVDTTNFDAFVPKPFTKTQLLAAMEDVLAA